MLKNLPSFFNLFRAWSFNRASHLDQRQVNLVQLRLNEMDAEWDSEARVSSIKHKPGETKQLGSLWVLHLKMGHVSHLLRIHLWSARVRNDERCNLDPTG